MERIDLQGTVTFQGEPVPAGDVRFTPDPTRGGKGPSAFAAIRDGEYNTRSGGKGPVQGPVRVAVSGFVSDEPFAAPLFPTYKTQIDVAPDTRTFDFEVPAAEAKKKRGAR